MRSELVSDALSACWAAGPQFPEFYWSNFEIIWTLPGAFTVTFFLHCSVSRAYSLTQYGPGCWADSFENRPVFEKQAVLTAVKGKPAGSITGRKLGRCWANSFQPGYETGRLWAKPAGLHCVFTKEFKFGRRRITVTSLFSKQKESGS